PPAGPLPNNVAGARRRAGGAPLTILVVGATGPTGSATVRELVARGERVRAVTRDRAKAEAMPDLAGAEIVVADSSQPETVDFAGVEKVYLVPPLAPGWNAMQRALIE